MPGEVDGCKDMAKLTSTVAASSVLLRDVAQDDLPIFFEHQRDPEASRMAAFPARNWDTFMAHWTKIMADKTNVIKTILYNGQVAGNIVSFEMAGQREVGYWLGREYWGKGIATGALSAFLGQVTERPLYAYAAKRNLASIRVLQKCGFTVSGENKTFDQVRGEEIEEVMLTLR